MDKFLSKEELKTAAPSPMLEALSTADDSILERIISENIARCESYLQGRYDAKTIFEARGEARSAVLLKYLKDLVVYDLYARQSRGQVGEAVKSRYEAAMHWLEQISQGRLMPELPTRKEATSEARMDSHPHYGNKF